MPYKDKEKQKEAGLRYKAEKRKWLNSYKSHLACELCGYNKHVAALQFHHRNSSEKERSISRMMNQNASKKDILDEINKCLCVCANCHAIIHAKAENEE